MQECFVLSFGRHMRQRVVDCFVLQNNVRRTKSAFSSWGVFSNVWFTISDFFFVWTVRQGVSLFPVTPLSANTNSFLCATLSPKECSDI